MTKPVAAEVAELVGVGNVHVVNRMGLFWPIVFLCERLESAGIEWRHLFDREAK